MDHCGLVLHTKKDLDLSQISASVTHSPWLIMSVIVKKSTGLPLSAILCLFTAESQIF